MIQLIKSVLLKSKHIDDWKIVVKRIHSCEIFFIKKEVDMNRGKFVDHFEVTVYKNFENNGVKYKGSSTTKIHPSMSFSEIRKKIEDTAFAASLVKNQYYSLVQPYNYIPPKLKSNFSQVDICEWIPSLIEAIFRPDNKVQGCINSCELFINRIHTKIINSAGVDVSFESYEADLDFITNWTENEKEIELYRNICFSDFKPDKIYNEIENMLIMSKEKALAIPTPSLSNQTILLTGQPVKDFFKYYYLHANAQNIYEKTSTAKLNENVQGENTLGDLINMKLDPYMNNSSMSKIYDNDGYPLKQIVIYENGILKNYWGTHRFSNYLDVETTGYIENFVVEGGSKSIEAMKVSPYLELLAFSHFEVNSLTGDFAGEIRLGKYFDGNKTIPVSGGSLSGNIKDVQNKIYFSKMLQQNNNFIGPKTIQLFNINISGS